MSTALDPAISARLRHTAEGLVPVVVQQQGSGEVLMLAWVKEVRLDCDGDTLLFVVDQVGAACHTGDHTCFDADLVHRVDD